MRQVAGDGKRAQARICGGLLRPLQARRNVHMSVHVRGDTRVQREEQGEGSTGMLAEASGGRRAPGVELVDDAAVLVDRVQPDVVGGVARKVESVHLNRHQRGL